MTGALFVRNTVVDGWDCGVPPLPLELNSDRIAILRDPDAICARERSIVLTLNGHAKDVLVAHQQGPLQACAVWEDERHFVILVVLTAGQQVRIGPITWAIVVRESSSWRDNVCSRSLQDNRWMTDPGRLTI